MIPNTRATKRQECGKNYGVGVDIGGTKILICIADTHGDIVYRRKVETTSDYYKIYEYIYQSIKNTSLTLEQIESIGFGVPGVTDSVMGTVIDAPAFKWKNEPFKEKMEQYFDCPVYVNNDVNCAAHGERWLGSAKNIEDFVFIAIGTGVGSAIFSNGAMIQGDQFMAGEIGYLLGDSDIPQIENNIFGEFGVFEKKTSGTALASHGVDPKVLFENFSAGEANAVSIVNRFITDLSIAIANVVSLLNPRKVIIGGGVSNSMSQVLGLIQGKVAQFTPIPVTIELSAMNEESGALGALAYAFEQVRAKEKTEPRDLVRMKPLKQVFPS